MGTVPGLSRSALSNWERIAQIPVSYESGVVFFSWQNRGVVLASVDVDDFENFAILNVEQGDAKRLAKACSDDAWDSRRFAEYKTEIDELSDVGRWLPLSSALDAGG